MSETGSHANRQSLAAATLGALGVVYGDIGTSPLYALRECFHGAQAVPLSELNVIGVLSLIFWSLILVVSIKYLVFVLRADNHGEGGILALTVLALPSQKLRQNRRLLFLLGLFGAGLLYGDGIITPAISVLGAVEGLHVATPALDAYVLPIALVILTGLFAIQSWGTGRVGGLFGPMMLLWFSTLGILGILHLFDAPEVFRAFNPAHAVAFFAANGFQGFVILGIVFLVVTGGEALYADIGHFGKLPIRISWFGLTLPALLLNYFGQGALLIAHPESIENPFYYMAPDWAQIPLIVLATCATIIASQAIISGSFSLANQAVHLGMSPRLKIVQTSSLARGQIYVPIINWGLFIGVIALVLIFRSSSNLASAYGMAVSTTMVITIILLYVVMRERWKWAFAVAAPIALFFLIIDSSFMLANAIKIFEGGWMPLLIGIGVAVMMTTWSRGREIIYQIIGARIIKQSQLLKELEEDPPFRPEGTSVFMTSSPDGVPLALTQNLRHNRVLHKEVAFVTIQTEDEPWVSPENRVEISEIGGGIHRIVAHYGFIETPDVREILQACKARGVDFTRTETSYFLGRETLEIGDSKTMPRWQKHLFAWMSRNARDASTYFGVPSEEIVEIGVKVEL